MYIYIYIYIHTQVYTHTCGSYMRSTCDMEVKTRITNTSTRMHASQQDPRASNKTSVKMCSNEKHVSYTADVLRRKQIDATLILRSWTNAIFETRT